MNTIQLDAALKFDPFSGDFGAPGDRVLRDRIVKCRKGGKCSNCQGDITPKSFIRSRVDVIDGDMMSWRWCEPCTTLMAHNDEEGFESRIK